MVGAAPRSRPGRRGGSRRPASGTRALVAPTGAAARPGAGAAGRATPVALTSTASAAFQPKVASMKALSQLQVAATISTGGAANEVSVPPIETLTNSTPSARVLEPLGHPGAEDERREHQRGQRHRRRLGDQRAEQRHEREAEPGLGHVRAHRQPARRGSRPAARIAVEHRPRRGDHHDHEHEQRLGVLAGLGVLDRHAPAGDRGHRRHQHHGPEAEHHLDLAEQVEQAGVARMAVRQALERPWSRACAGGRRRRGPRR